MRTPTIRSTSRIAVIVLVTIVGLHSLCALAQSQPHPLAPPDLSSPRATLTNFLKLMDAAYHYWKSEGRTYENRGQRAAIGRLAQRFCDLNDIAPSVRNNVGRETAVFMKEVLDRIELPPWEEIPDEAMIAAKPGGLNRWTIPHTEITLIRLKDGLREGQWVFNSETDERAPECYEQVKQLPYKPGASEGFISIVRVRTGLDDSTFVDSGTAGVDAGAPRRSGRVAMVRAGSDACRHSCTAGTDLSHNGALVPEPGRGWLLFGGGVPNIRHDPSADRDGLSFRSGVHYRKTVRRAGFRPGPGFARRAGCSNSGSDEPPGDGADGSAMVQATPVERASGAIDHSGHGRGWRPHCSVRGRTISGCAADYTRRRCQREWLDGGAGCAGHAKKPFWQPHDSPRPAVSNG